MAPKGKNAQKGKASTVFKAGRRPRVRRTWAEQQEVIGAAEDLDRHFGFDLLSQGAARTGFLFNIRPTSISDDDNNETSAIDCYFVEEDGSTFRARVSYAPYFLIHVDGSENDVREVETLLLRQHQDVIFGMDHLSRDDLDLPNHLSGIKQSYLKIRFRNIQDLISLRQSLLPLVQRNRQRRQLAEQSSDLSALMGNESSKPSSATSSLELITDMREYDVPYVQRGSLKIVCDAM